MLGPFNKAISKKAAFLSRRQAAHPPCLIFISQVHSINSESSANLAEHLLRYYCRSKKSAIIRK
jgi:hypothetical protein